ncbi:MAG: T9SS type A sorting domain-containing protein [Bacteroidetes bacterium]|nr:T9SS type A sorting domain-containing protein [Bacteroidota bacterium]
MKKNYRLILLAALSLTASAYGQNVRNCGTMQHLHDMELNDPTTAQRMHSMERETEQWIHTNSANKVAAVVTIPVVVHVVYNTSSQNISEAQINSQINILNADFRKLNSDIGLLPSVFSGLAADCEIQFCLAQRDPNGNATSGIIRKSTTATSFSSNDNIKRNVNGGSDAWPSSSYLNIWVGNLSGGLLGYAQFPGGTASTDGVVCTYTAFGNVGTATAPFHKGRTATHEIGHWLNLRHIWGDATCGNDQVSDTPTQQTANTGCPSFPKVTCSNGPNGDLHMNYMDYTDDACMYMFTNGQKSRMLASLNTTRASLLNSLGCVPPSTSSCGVPAGLSATSISTTSATLNWAAVSGAINYNVQFKAISSSTWITGTSTGTSLSATGLSSNTAYEFQVKANCANSSSAFSASSNFTTNTAACTDAYETNNSKAKAKSIAVNTNITAKIGNSTDKDWFIFSTVAGATNLKVVLDQLPLDYDLTLYNSSGAKLAVSQLGGTSTETIIRNTASAATYYVKVVGFNGAFISTSCYNLIVNTSGSSFRSGELTEYVEGNVNLEKVNSNSSFIVFPNPVQDVLQLNFISEESSIVEVKLMDLMGKVIETKTIEANDGLNNAEMNTSFLENGVYMIRLTQDDEVQVRKFIVKH